MELLACLKAKLLFYPFPPPPFDACRKQPTTTISLSLVLFDDNDYSVLVVFRSCVGVKAPSAVCNLNIP
jgi:hypothetical protein